MSEVTATSPAQLCVGDRIHLAPLTRYALTETTQEQRVAACAGPVEIIGHDRDGSSIVLRTAVFDVAVPSTIEVGRVVG